MQYRTHILHPPFPPCNPGDIGQCAKKHNRYCKKNAFCTSEHQPILHGTVDFCDFRLPEIWGTYGEHPDLIPALQASEKNEIGTDGLAANVPHEHRNLSAM